MEQEMTGCTSSHEAPGFPQASGWMYRTWGGRQEALACGYGSGGQAELKGSGRRRGPVLGPWEREVEGMRKDGTAGPGKGDGPGKTRGGEGQAA